MASGSEMLGQRTRFSADIYLDMLNAAVGQVGNREIDHTVTAEEGKCSDGAIGLHPVDPDLFS